MTSKKIIAFMLTVCMLLTCMPAFAATIVLDDVTIPAEGLSVASGRTLWEGLTDGEEADDLLIVLTGPSSQLFPLMAANNQYAGVTLSFTAKSNNEVMPEGVPTEFTVVDAEVYYTRATGDGTQLCLGIYPDEVVEKSPELSALEDVTAYFGFTKSESPFSISDLVIKPGTWAPETVDTGVFPEDTVFLSHQEFSKYPSAFNIENNYGFKNLIFEFNHSTSGPYQFFVPEVTGEYNVYVQLISNNASLGDRAVKLSVDGKEMNFKPGDYEASKLPSTMVPMWCYETNSKTVTLTKDEIVAVELLGNAYGRPTVIAFVPANENADVLAAIKAAPQTLQVAAEDVERVVAEAYHPNFVEGELSVTVNGESVAASAGRAAKASSGYKKLSDGKVPYGLPARVLPETNTFPTYVTALDAIAQYMLDKGDEAPILATAIHDGKIDGLAVLVNGVLATDLDWYEIKAGDVITFADKANKAAFDPVSLKGGNTVVTGGLIHAIGTPSDSGRVYANGKLKFCLNISNLSSTLGEFATKTDETGLKDCYLVGYTTMRKDNTTGFTDLDLNGKVYFENVPILGYNVDASGTLTQGSGRLDLATGGRVGYTTSDPRYKDKDDNTVTNADGKYLIKPYDCYSDYSFLYNWDNVYLVNSSTDVSLKAMKGKNRYILTTGGMHVVDVVIATYADDGVTVTDTEVMKEQVVMFNAPLNIPVAANQKAFVWGTKIYEGTTMVPAMAPLLGSNFAN